MSVGNVDSHDVNDENGWDILNTFPQIRSHGSTLASVKTRQKKTLQVPSQTQESLAMLNHPAQNESRRNVPRTQSVCVPSFVPWVPYRHDTLIHLDTSWAGGPFDLAVPPQPTNDCSAHCHMWWTGRWFSDYFGMSEIKPHPILLVHLCWQHTREVWTQGCIIWTVVSLMLWASHSMASRLDTCRCNSIITRLNDLNSQCLRLTWCWSS